MIPESNQAQFNQASYQQIRLNERILGNQRLWNFPLVFNDIYKSYNYEVIFNSQSQILTEICPKLGEKEEKTLISAHDEIEDFMQKNKIFKNVTISKGYMAGLKNGNRVNSENWLKLKKLLFKFGISLMKSMDSHGFGNPNKSDPTAAVIEM